MRSVLGWLDTGDMEVGVNPPSLRLRQMIDCSVDHLRNGKGTNKTRHLLPGFSSERMILSGEADPLTLRSWNLPLICWNQWQAWYHMQWHWWMRARAEGTSIYDSGSGKEGAGSHTQTGREWDQRHNKARNCENILSKQGEGHDREVAKTLLQLLVHPLRLSPSSQCHHSSRATLTASSSR